LTVNGTSQAVTTLKVFAYGSLVLNASATITSLCLSEMLGVFLFDALKRNPSAPFKSKVDDHKGTTLPANLFKMMKWYGVTYSCVVIILHCTHVLNAPSVLALTPHTTVLISLVFGVLFLMAEILMYIFLSEKEKALKIILTVIVAWAVFPLLFLFRRSLSRDV
jgi:hypothetical protein